MAFKCTSVYCEFGHEWEAGESVTKNHDGTVDPHNRADSYSQTPSYENPNISGLIDGLCLNCDAERDLDLARMP